MNTPETVPTTGSTFAEVTVILSTFNGSAFLPQQLDSLYAQTHPGVRILARDDGSSDTTRGILQREQAAQRIALLDGHDNLGAARSFLELLRNAAATRTGFIAFCDQDDVWHPDKLARAVAALSAIRDERAAMYCSRLEIVDAELTSVGLSALPGRIGFGNALVENVCVGCTIVLNRKAIDLLCRNLPASVPVHDWWCYLVLSCFGEIVFDRETSIQYRQHPGNVFGVALGPLDRAKRSLRRFAGNGAGRHWQSEQAAVLLATFGDRIPAAHRRVLNEFVVAKTTLWRRLRLALSTEIWRQTAIDGLVWRFLVLINRY
jgi:glycosyltransferase involved in cell wall biosynthesis